MRGKGVKDGAGVLVLGITPAYAGKRHDQRAGNLVGGDHPRVCGEKLFAMLTACVLVGSPPRMRGKGLLF